MEIGYKDLTVKEINELLKSGKVSAVEILNEAKKVIKEKDGDINAFLEVFDSAEESAKRADEMFKKGTDTLLTGIPIAIKDNICIEGESVTAGSKILKSFKSPFNSTVVENLKKQGAVIIGRTNMDEFAMGSSTENSSYKKTSNPVDLERVPGGSSGGSAAAVAMGAVPLALGSDTGGSVRQPASFCGLVGLKPTYGNISRHGLIMLGSSLDVIGVFSRNVEDAEILYNAIKEEEVRYDNTFNLYKKESVSNKKNIVGVPDLSNLNLPKETMDAFNASLKKLEESGYEKKVVDLPSMSKATSIYYIIQPAEASSNLARFDGIRYGQSSEGNNIWDVYIGARTNNFGKEVIRRIVVGTYVLSAGYYDAYYKKAIQARETLKREFLKALESVDVIAMPTTPSHAFKHNEKVDSVDMYTEDRLTLQANLTGLPAISIPMQTGGLPIGIQLMGGYNSEDLLFEYSSKILN